MRRRDHDQLTTHLSPLQLIPFACDMCSQRIQLSPLQECVQMRKRYNEKGLDVCKVIKILEPTGNTARHFPVGRVHRLIQKETMLNMSVLVHQFTSPPSSNTSNSLVMPPVTVTTRSSATEAFELAGNAVRDNKKHRR